MKKHQIALVSLLCVAISLAVFVAACKKGKVTSIKEQMPLTFSKEEQVLTETFFKINRVSEN